MPADHPKDDPSRYPALGRMFNWVDQPGNDRKLMWYLIGACALLVLAPLVVHQHVHFPFLGIPGVYGAMGFVFFAALILAAKYLRFLLSRPEDYYAPRAVDSEAYPEAELERAEHDA